VTSAQGKTELSGGQAGEYKPQGVLGSAFGQYRWGNGGWVSAAAGAGDVDLNDIQRAFMIGAARRVELSTSKAITYSVGAEGGRWFAFQGLRTGPFAALNYDHVRVDGLQELGSDATAMWFAEQKREAFVGKLGWKLEADWRFAGVALQPSLGLAYGHDFKADRNSVTAGLVTLNGAFALPGYLPQKNWGEVDARVGADLGHGLRARLEYSGRYGDRGHDNLGTVGVSYSF
jgi:outer membrane lipase/esterase